jgi:hypothetical protein
MSTIVRFPLERVKRNSGDNKDEQILAEIIVFEGVRYTREGSHEKAVKNLKSALKK